MEVRDVLTSVDDAANVENVDEQDGKGEMMVEGDLHASLSVQYRLD